MPLAVALRSPDAPDLAARGMRRHVAFHVWLLSLTATFPRLGYIVASAARGDRARSVRRPCRADTWGVCFGAALRARAQMSVRLCLVVLLGARRGARRGRGLTLGEPPPSSPRLRRGTRPYDACIVRGLPTGVTCVSRASPGEPWGVQEETGSGMPGDSEAGPSPDSVAVALWTMPRLGWQRGGGSPPRRRPMTGLCPWEPSS